MCLTYKTAYVTDSQILKYGHGGSVVSFHELRALTHVAGELPQVYQRLGQFFYEQYYAGNPFMLDYYYASLLQNPEQIELAHFYGASFNLTAKRLSKAKKFATVPAHNLEVSLEEWCSFGYWQPPPPHLTDDAVFRYLVHGLKDLTVVCPSTNSANYLKGKLSLNPVVIPHGTDIPASYSATKPDFNVLHISAFGPDKGQTYLLNAMKLFPFKGQLTVVCNNIVEAVFHDVPNTKVKQSVSEAEKSSLYLNASVYVQPSITEGWGLTVGEAMAHGTPVIVTEGVGAKDMVEDGKDGFIIPIRKPDKIAEAIQYFQDNPSEVKRMGENARRKAESYSWDKIEEMYERLYRDSCNR